MKLPSLITLICLILMTNHSLAKEYDPAEIAYKIKEAYPLFGTKIPKELCEGEKTYPCLINKRYLVKQIENFKDVKYLTYSANDALKHKFYTGDEVWEFDFCQPVLLKNERCFPEPGYAVISNNQVMFYVFTGKDYYERKREQKEKQTNDVSEFKAENKTKYLEALVSTDDDVRKTALQYLSREFSSSPNTKPRYQYFGDKLLPYLVRVINNHEDKYSHYAVETIYHMAFYHDIKSGNSILGMNDKVKEFIDKFNYKNEPNPLNYSPVKEALILTLKNSQNFRSQEWAAKALANGFTPKSEIEEVFFTELRKEKDRKIHYAILAAIEHLSTRKDYEGIEYMPVLGLNLEYKYDNNSTAGTATGSGEKKQTLLENQPIIIDANHWVLKFFLQVLTEGSYILDYQLTKSSQGKGRNGKTKGIFGKPLVFNLEEPDLKIESTITVKNIPKCFKRQISSCYR